MLVLAGPGSGKTQVLTCRIGSLLSEGKDRNFRILALTFTNKAADEMKERVAGLVPGLEERVLISTFHGFCGQVLRQHGVHVGINSDFAIYSLVDDRKAVLEDALRRGSAAGHSVDSEDVRLLGLIDAMKARLIHPDAAMSALARFPDKEHIALVYRLYEDELCLNNALDFNSLIVQTHSLFSKFPAIAARYRKSNPYWLVDEFQDTTEAQYRLVRVMAGDDFRNIFAVADDDQIIYQWNGASYRQIERFMADFQANVTQLSTNYRCPPVIVAAANRLVAYNRQRSESKQPLVAGKKDLRLPEDQQIQLRVFADAEQEASGIAAEIAEKGQQHWDEVTVLARNRALLESVNAALSRVGVPSFISQRRDDFLSAELRFLVACLRQAYRPLDRRTLATLVDSFNRAANLEIPVEQVMVDAEATGRGFLVTWQEAALLTDLNDRASLLLKAACSINDNPMRGKVVIDETLVNLEPSAEPLDEHDSDLKEDIVAWRQLSRDIGRHLGASAPLEQFLQELQLRSKEPPVKQNTVTLMTVHGAKGREFDTVYLVGLAEDLLPSYQSRQKGDASPEMEEERRNCFVAITRAKECLVLSRAEKYRGWSKKPSRFLVEMGFVAPS
jgi:DNA helicase-2/ATP-dependent DNA helicase PcrA